MEGKVPFVGSRYNHDLTLSIIQVTTRSIGILFIEEIKDQLAY